MRFQNRSNLTTCQWLKHLIVAWNCFCYCKGLCCKSIETCAQCSLPIFGCYACYGDHRAIRWCRSAKNYLIKQKHFVNIVKNNEPQECKLREFHRTNEALRSMPLFYCCWRLTLLQPAIILHFRAQCQTMFRFQVSHHCCYSVKNLAHKVTKSCR